MASYSFRRLADWDAGPAEDNLDHPLRITNNLVKHLARVWGVSRDVPSLGVHEIEITQDTDMSLKVKVMPFMPQPGDKTDYTWKDKDDNEARLEMPWYCISDIDDVRDQLRQYIQSSMRLYLKKYVDWSERIVGSTFGMALRLVDQSDLIRETLILWSSTRLIEETWRICGEDTLGMEPVQGDAPWAGIIPVTPIMDQQLDQLVIHFVLKPLSEWILRNLYRKFQDAAKKKTLQHWLEVFVASFVLLHSCAVQLAAENRFSKRYGMSGRFGPVGHYSDAEDQFNTARTILFYFHHVLQGASLFTSSITPEQGAFLDQDQLNYLENMKDWISSRQDQLLGLQQDSCYEHGLYFVHQLFFEGYDARPKVIAELPAGTS